MIDHYDWAGGREAMLRFGPAGGPVVIMLPALFEEHNRTRAFAVTICRMLAERGVASVVPDLPGQGESIVGTEDVTLTDLRSGFAAAVEHLHQEKRRVYSASIRSGAIIDADSHALGHWYFSPMSGQQQIADLAKILAATGRSSEAHLLRNSYQIDDTTSAFEIAGNVISVALLQDLTSDIGKYPMNSLGVPTRILRLDSDRAEAHRHIPGTPLWRRAEPSNDPALAALLAEDIADWIALCEA